MCSSESSISDLEVIEPSDNVDECLPKRALPLTSYEKSVLVDLVGSKKSVIESKRTDFGTTRKKQIAWEKLESEFCSYPNTQKRTAMQLKKAWENLKTRAKDEVKVHKRKIRKTGGGSTPKALSHVTEKICSIVPDQLTPLVNPYDCDGSDDIGIGPEAKEKKHMITSESCHDISVSVVPLGKTDNTKRKQKDPRSSLVDMEYEEHKLRLKSLSMKYNLDQTTKLRKLELIEIKHEKQIEVLNAKLLFYQKVPIINIMDGEVINDNFPN